MKSSISGSAAGLQAGRRSSENQWSPTFSTQAFGLKVTASENDGSQEERYGKKGTAGNFIEDVRVTSTYPTSSTTRTFIVKPDIQPQWKRVEVQLFVRLPTNSDPVDLFDVTQTPKMKSRHFPSWFSEAKTNRKCSSCVLFALGFVL